MSNFLAVATVSATLRSVVEAAAQAALPGVDPSVTTGRPDSLASTNGGSDAAGVSVFLYQVSPNAHWSTADLPTRRGDGSLVRPPQAALDLFYLLSFFGSETTREPERMLGSVVSRLHSEPLLSRQRISAIIASEATLAGSDLDRQVDLVRFVPVALNLEELSKLWATFVQTAYRLSVVYRGSVVLIEPEDELPRPTLPVRRPMVYVEPFRMPVIEQALGEDADGDPDPGAPLLVGGNLVLRGRNLRRVEGRPGPGDTTLAELVTRVMLGEAEATPELANVTATEIRIALAEPPFPSGTLEAGIRGVRVAHRRLLGEPGFETEHRGVESNVAAFVLRPTVAGVVFTPAVPAENEEDPPVEPPRVVVTVEPAVGDSQRVRVLLNEFLATGPDPNEPPRGYVLEAVADGVTVTADVTQAEAGDYLVRVRVDGAESPLTVDQTMDGDEPGENFGRYVGPQVEIPS